MSTLNSASVGLHPISAIRARSLWNMSSSFNSGRSGMAATSHVLCSSFGERRGYITRQGSMLHGELRGIPQQFELLANTRCRRSCDWINRDFFFKKCKQMNDPSRSNCWGRERTIWAQQIINYILEISFQLITPFGINEFPSKCNSLLLFCIRCNDL